MMYKLHPGLEVTWKTLVPKSKPTPIYSRMLSTRIDIWLISCSWAAFKLLLIAGLQGLDLSSNWCSLIRRMSFTFVIIDTGHVYGRFIWCTQWQVAALGDVIDVAGQTALLDDIAYFLYSQPCILKSSTSLLNFFSLELEQPQNTTVLAFGSVPFSNNNITGVVSVGQNGISLSAIAHAVWMSKSLRINNDQLIH